MRKAISYLYIHFLDNRHKFVRPLLVGSLIFAIIVGGSLRAMDIKNNFSINNGFEFYVNMASHFWTHPGGYNFDSGLRIKERPEDYVFTRNPNEPPTGSFENEKGWMFVLSLIFNEGQRGIGHLAETVVFWQLLLDLGVIICLFFTGRAIAGSLGGSCSALLYAIFKPSISLASWASYYYWAIPFSALSLVFWTAIYRPESKKRSLKWAAFLFFLYGMLIGLAVFGRLVFLFLPLAMSPLIFFREQNFRRAMILLIVMLIGEGIMLAPQIWLTHKWFDKYTLSTRGKWHHVVSGLGGLPNPWRLGNSSDLGGVQWAIEQGGPDLNKPGVGIEPYDRFMKREAIRLFKERPHIFWRNLKSNLNAGITLTPAGGVRYQGGPSFHGISDVKAINSEIFPRNNMKIAAIYPWLVLSVTLIIFIFLQERFGALLSALFQGGYLAGIISLYLLPTDVHIAGYLPIFVLLTGTALAILFKTLLAMPEGALRCWLGGLGLKQYLKTFKDCLRENWDQEQIRRDKLLYDEKTLYSTSKVLIGLTAFFALIYLIDLYMEKAWKKDIASRPIDSQTILEINSLLLPETTGGFETWGEDKDSPPAGWSFLKNDGVRRSKDEENVLMGASSLELTTDGQNITYLGFRIPSDLLYYMIGKSITVEGWAKSANSSPDKISVSLVHKLGPPLPESFYKNSGDWEKLSLSYKVPDDVQFLYIGLRVNSRANAPAYFDGFSLRIDKSGDDDTKPSQYEHEEKLYASASLSLDNAEIDAAISALNQMEKEFNRSIFTTKLRQRIKKLDNNYAEILPEPVVRWNMEDDAGKISGSSGIKPINTSIVKGVKGKALQLNGQDSYMETQFSFQDWKGVTISLWVKPEPKDAGALSVILDNGHSGAADFAIQSADVSGIKWVWHCNGADLFFDLPLGKWSRVVVSADGKTGAIHAYVNGVKIGENKSKSPFKFGNTPLMIGKLAKSEDRHFKGSIDEITVWNKALKTKNYFEQ